MANPTTIDDYIDACAEDAQLVLRRIREVVREAAPDADECISYQMPAWKQDGILLYVGAFKKHIGLFPPVSGDDALIADAAPYAGPKGKLKIPLDEPIPFDLIRRIVESRVAIACVKKVEALP